MNSMTNQIAISVRSKLFVPASRPELFQKAFASAADAISIDLEDAVPEAGKKEARLQVRDWLLNQSRAAIGKTLIVRVNGLSTVHFSDDVNTIACSALDVLNLPKAESAGDVQAVSAMLARLEQERGIERPIGILANIESPRGLRNAHEIAAADARVVGLQLGFGDLFEPFDIDRKDTIAVRQVQLAVRLAAAEAGVHAYDGAFPGVLDIEGFRAEAQQARKLGFAGKSCIHPAQVAAANEAFSPDKDEIEFATRVVGAWQEASARGLGAIVVDGKMIDQPYAVRAQTLLALAQRYSL